MDNNDGILFGMSTLFPNADALFSHSLQPLEKIKKDCFVVLDTNVLLLPYDTGKASLEQISNIYKRLIRQKRLVVPGQVAREFAKNRGKNIGELFQQISRKRNSAASLKTDVYPLLEALNEYKAMLKLEEEINEKFYDYRKSIAQLLEQINLWQWNDPVSKLYKELFSKNVVLDIELNKTEIQKDLTRRIEQKIPPGYKDAAKPDSGIGDLLIWYTILAIGEKYKKSVIFVSGEEKSDWQIRSEGQTLYPRYELIDEYRQKSDGASFYILSFSSFLDLFGVSESVVAEVREKEIQQVEPSSPPLIDAMSVFRALFVWLAGNYPNQLVREVDSEGDHGVDFEIVYNDGSKVGVDAKMISAATEAQLSFLIESESALVKSKKYKNIIIALIAHNDQQLKFLEILFRSKKVKPKIGIALLMGYITDQKKFEPVYFE